MPGKDVQHSTGKRHLWRGESLNYAYFPWSSLYPTSPASARLSVSNPPYMRAESNGTNR
jgi:hypothetical protein